MFTGIIEEVGRLVRAEARGETMVLTVEASKVLQDVHLGDSIAVNGVCLTVTGFDQTSFNADVMPETYRKTNLSALRPGSRLNLERAMPADGRFGGHIVQGHVDGTGRIRSRNRDQNAVLFTIEPADRSLMRHIIPKGSIAVDGISLTVVDADEASFSVSIIPHTLSQTILSDKQPGDTVNLETDIIAKYIERLIGGSRPASNNGESAGVTAEFLAEHGFL